MEEVAKNNQSSVISGKSKLRYPLRSASKSKDQANKSPEVVGSSASKRGRPPSVSKSVSVLELSGKDKANAVKPPRRLSIPAKPAVSPRQKSTPNVTPISDYRARRSANGCENCDTPQSDVSRSSIRRKFNVLASASYWLSQIKLSESAGKHSISLGFFKLALEAGCETLQRLRDELKQYAGRHNLSELGDTVKSLFESYEIFESLEQLQVSETCSHVPDDATTPSGDDVRSTSSVTGTRKLKPKSLNTDNQASSANMSTHRTRAVSKIRTSVNLSTDNIKKKVQRAGKQEAGNGEDNKIKNQDENSTVKPQLGMEETLEGNKENMDAPMAEEISMTEGN
ncbi:hypothetical protein RND81_13G121000 [Saponaria officinalis]|uniref:Uncharacterized protein n=1 Tax=Saponaria officinalis TaxID=3572 RepID=A0AAW1GX09_SAPOF